MSADVELRGCEYLGGCPSLGSRVLNKVELHFDQAGLTVTVATQGLFTLAAAQPVLVLGWPDISVLSPSHARPEHRSKTHRHVIHSAMKVVTMRLDLRYRLTIRTSAWGMDIGVRVAPAELARELEQLLAHCRGPTPVVQPV